MKKGLIILTLLFIGIWTSFSYSLSYKTIAECYYNSYKYEKKQDYTQAIKSLMPVYKAYPRGYTVNLRLGWLYYLKGNYANSEYHYKKALQANSYSIEAMLGLSLPLMAQGRWQEVEKVMLNVLKIDYYNYYGNLRYCLALLKQNKYKIAEKVARKMLFIYPTDVNFLNYLGISLYKEGKKAYARSIFESVLILSPNNEIAKKYLKNNQK